MGQSQSSRIPGIWSGAWELHARGLVRDLPAEYLRAVRPSVHRDVSFSERVVQLIDHMDWQEGAFQRAAFEDIVAGRPVSMCWRSAAFASATSHASSSVACVASAIR